jgi:uncharacterized membrane protein YtjA (UPF0391 family)
VESGAGQRHAPRTAQRTVAEAAHPPPGGRCGWRPAGLPTKESNMLHYAVVFFVIALIAAVFGFSGIAAGAAGIAKILFVVFLVMAVASFLINLAKGR